MARIKKWQGTNRNGAANSYGLEMPLLYESIVREMREGVNVIDAATMEIVYSNPEFERMFGYKPGELAGMKVSVLNSPAERPPAETMRQIAAEIERADAWRGEIHNIRKDGTSFWCNVVISRLKTVKYSKLYISLHEDITARKKLESENLENLSSLRAIIDNCPDNIIMQDSDLRYTKVINPQLGVREADMIGKRDEDIMPPADAARLTAIKKEVLASGKALTMEVPVTNTRGETEFFHGRYAPMGGAGNRLIGYFKNITDIRKAQEDLKRGEEKFREIFYDAAIPLCLASASDGTLVEANPAFEQAFGLPPGEAAGRILPELGIGPMPALRHNAKTRTRQEMVLRRTDGRTLEALVRVSVVRVEGGPCLFLSVSDITEINKARRTMEDAKNIALREVLAQLESEKTRLKNDLATGLEEALGPLLTRMAANKDLRKYAEVARGRLEGLTAPLREPDDKRRLRSLSRREREICEMIRGGLATKEMARILGVSPHTVNVQRRSIRRKLGIINSGNGLAGFLQD